MSGYTPSGARSVLGWLKKQGLVIDEEKGKWTITNDGINRLVYYWRSIDRKPQKETKMPTLMSDKSQLPSFDYRDITYLEKLPTMSLGKKPPDHSIYRSGKPRGEMAKAIISLKCPSLANPVPQLIKLLVPGKLFSLNTPGRDKSQQPSFEQRDNALCREATSDVPLPLLNKASLSSVI